ncbi:hypothetical protein FF38_08361 [Lucilia cuprina]|uniref:Uncharacterized protein n=1 Tax=Lucilia cuprina TaxID=7375 RepID=A0A0L0BM83_LUCCU|nr:hypothetical protein FF38_08361 [Lucilia cuprina]
MKTVDYIVWIDVLALVPAPPRLRHHHLIVLVDWVSIDDLRSFQEAFLVPPFQLTPFSPPPSWWRRFYFQFTFLYAQHKVIVLCILLGVTVGRGGLSLLAVMFVWGKGTAGTIDIKQQTSGISLGLKQSSSSSSIASPLCDCSLSLISSDLITITS